MLTQEEKVRIREEEAYREQVRRGSRGSVNFLVVLLALVFFPIGIPLLFLWGLGAGTKSLAQSGRWKRLAYGFGALYALAFVIIGVIFVLQWLGVGR